MVLPNSFPAKPEAEGKIRKNYHIAYEYRCDCGDPKEPHTNQIAILPSIGKKIVQHELVELLNRSDVVEAAMYARDGDEWIKMDEEDALWPEGIAEPT